MRNIEKLLLLLVLVGMTILAGCGKEKEFIYDVKANYLDSPCFDTETAISFSWKIGPVGCSAMQTSYEIVVSKDKEIVWDSGKIESSESTQIEYEGPVLMPENEYSVEVIAWNGKNKKIKMGENESLSMKIGPAEATWAEAEWIGTRDRIVNSIEESVYGLTEYKVSYDFITPKWDAGFVYGADNYGYEDYQLLAMRDMVSSEECTDEFLQTKHSVVLEVTDTHRTATLDGKCVLDEDIASPIPLRQIGFWSVRGDTYAYFDNLLVTDVSGTVIYSEDFEHGEDTVFSPLYTKIEDGMLRVESGFTMIPGLCEPAPVLRRTFESEDVAKVQSATWYSTALGNYELDINGEKVTATEYLSPGVSEYDDYVFYRAYDVTDSLKSGANELKVTLGHGRYNRAGYDWSNELAYKGILTIRYADGKIDRIVSDSDWSVTLDGPIRSDDLYSGEFYDATRADASQWEWNDVNVIDVPEGIRTIPSIQEPVVALGEPCVPVSVNEPAPGVYVYDFGKNMQGVCELIVPGKTGDVVMMRYAEYLNSEDLAEPDDVVGTIYTHNLYSARNTDYFMKSSDEPEKYSPTLVYRAFRYLQITGITEPIPFEDICAYTVASDINRTGEFACLDEDLNAIYDAVYLTELDNYVDIPTDCAQRDERLGWAGDAQVMASTACYNQDVHNIYSSYLYAMVNAQNEDGAYPEIAPITGSGDGYGANGWSDAGVILPYRLYQYYGDTSIVKNNLDSMCAYIEYLAAKSENYVCDDSGYGDHNSPSGSDNVMMNIAESAGSAMYVAQMCEDMGDNRASRMREIADGFASMWNSMYVGENGLVKDESQSGIVLSLSYNLYGDIGSDEDSAMQAGISQASQLHTILEYSDYHPQTGFITTEYLLPVLSRYGYVEDCYRILGATGYPSYLDMLSHDRTTLSESWFTVSEDSDGDVIINGSMNHPGLGSVVRWFYEGILGIRQDEGSIGYSHFTLEPLVGGELKGASGSYESIHGTIESSWEIEDGKMHYSCIVPPQTSATLILHGKLPEGVSSYVTDLRARDDVEIHELEAGQYEFCIDVE